MGGHMDYTVTINARAAELIRAGLGRLPHDDVRGLIEDIGQQLAAQERAARLPRVPGAAPEAALAQEGS